MDAALVQPSWSAELDLVEARPALAAVLICIVPLGWVWQRVHSAGILVFQEHTVVCFLSILYLLHFR